MGIPYAWFLTFYIFKVCIPGANTMKYHCSKAKCFTVYIYCSRNQTINQKFRGSKTIWDEHSIPLNGMLLFQRATPKLSVLHRDGTAVTNCRMILYIYMYTWKLQSRTKMCWKTSSMREKKEKKRQKTRFVVFSSFDGINTCPMAHFNTNFNDQLPF